MSGPVVLEAGIPIPKPKAKPRTTQEFPLLDMRVGESFQLRISRNEYAQRKPGERDPYEVARYKAISSVRAQIQRLCRRDDLVDQHHPGAARPEIPFTSRKFVFRFVEGGIRCWRTV